MAVSTMSRWRVYAVIYGAYMFFYFNKKNLAYFMPHLMETLNLTKGEVGILGSVFEMASAIASLYGGILVDSMSPKALLVVALLVSGFANFCMCFSPSIKISALLWGLNGLAQSFGWPCIAKIFMAWFPDPAERGALYSILSTNQNVGAAALPLVLLPALDMVKEANAASTDATTTPWIDFLRYWDWKVTLIIPAISGLIYALVILTLCTDAPDGEAKINTDNKASKQQEEKPKKTQEKHSAFQVIMSNTVLWQLAVCYICIGLVRSYFSDWGAVYIMEVHNKTGASQAETTALVTRCMSLLEVGGLFGGIIAGVVSDKVFGGRRSPVIAIFTLCIAPLAFMLSQEVHSHNIDISIAFFLVGFCSFAPHVLIGLAARELTDPRYNSTAGGFVSFSSKLGSSLAGAPLGHFVHNNGWGAAFSLVSALGVGGSIAVFPLWSRTAFKQKTA
eukprot:m.328772 g.328772  ORF g.328772 m.328772 type:complete len:448 (-) comp16566_c0_seq6:4150-5493(-)